MSSRDRITDAADRMRASGEERAFLDVYATVGEAIARRRGKLGLSQRELAELTGTTQSAIARLEGGGRAPRLDTLLRIAGALECELDVRLRPRRR